MNANKSHIRNIVLILSLITLAFLIFFSPNQNEEKNKSFEEKVIDAIEFDPINEVTIKNIFLLDDFEDGYICVALDNEDRMVFSYIEKDKRNEDKLVGKAAVFGSNESYVNNINPLKIFKVPLINFSQYTFYFGCCRSSKFKKILVNGESPKVYNIDVMISKRVYKLSLWFSISKHKPIVEYAK